MGRAFLQRAHFRKTASDLAAHLFVFHPRTFLVNEERICQTWGLCVALLHVVFQNLFQLVAKWYNALLVSFSRHFQLVGGEIHVGIVQSDELRNAHACLVEH